MIPALDLAAEFWAADLACQAANEKIWATGREPGDTDPDAVLAGELDTRCGQLLDELRDRAGNWVHSWECLRELAEEIDEMAGDPQPDGLLDSLHAAAALRVFRSRFVLEDAECLQPGGELPAVGVYAGSD